MKKNTSFALFLIVYWIIFWASPIFITVLIPAFAWLLAIYYILVAPLTLSFAYKWLGRRYLTIQKKFILLWLISFPLLWILYLIWGYLEVLRRGAPFFF
jgi:hypothetical protein